MNARIDLQTLLGPDGRPAFVVVPASDFERIRPLLEAAATPMQAPGIPQEVVEAHVLHDVPMVKAWREHLGLTQQEVCARAGLLQPALARMESGATRMRKATREKLAAAMGLTLEQLG